MLFRQSPFRIPSQIMTSSPLKSGMKSRVVAWAIALNLLLSVPLSAAVEIHVAPAPRGDDAHTGTAASPLATPQAAQAQVRRIIGKGLTEPVEVIFVEGIHRIAAPRRWNCARRIPEP